MKNSQADTNSIFQKKTKSIFFCFKEEEHIYYINLPWSRSLGRSLCLATLGAPSSSSPRASHFPLNITPDPERVIQLIHVPLIARPNVLRHVSGIFLPFVILIFVAF